MDNSWDPKNTAPDFGVSLVTVSSGVFTKAQTKEEQERLLRSLVTTFPLMTSLVCEDSDLLTTAPLTKSKLITLFVSGDQLTLDASTLPTYLVHLRFTGPLGKPIVSLPSNLQIFQLRGVHESEHVEATKSLPKNTFTDMTGTCRLSLAFMRRLFEARLFSITAKMDGACEAKERPRLMVPASVAMLDVVVARRGAPFVFTFDRRTKYTNLISVTLGSVYGDRPMVIDGDLMHCCMSYFKVHNAIINTNNGIPATKLVLSGHIDVKCDNMPPGTLPLAPFTKCLSVDVNRGNFGFHKLVFYEDFSGVVQPIEQLTLKALPVDHRPLHIADLSDDKFLSATVSKNVSLKRYDNVKIV